MRDWAYDHDPLAILHERYPRLGNKALLARHCSPYTVATFPSALSPNKTSSSRCNTRHNAPKLPHGKDVDIVQQWRAADRCFCRQQMFPHPSWEQVGRRDKETLKLRRDSLTSAELLQTQTAPSPYHLCARGWTVSFTGAGYDGI